MRVQQHHPHPHVHPHPHPVVAPGAPIGWRSLVAMGLAGGLVPSPSALVELLGAIALKRAWFGVMLVVAYGLGMAVTLTGAGLALGRARDAIDRRLWRSRPGRFATVAKVLPAVTATLIVGAGLLLAFRGVAKL